MTSSDHEPYTARNSILDQPRWITRELQGAAQRVLKYGGILEDHLPELSIIRRNLEAPGGTLCADGTDAEWGLPYEKFLERVSKHPPR